MLEIFFPDLFVKTIQDIDLANLISKKNIKGLILDIDNTLVANHVREADAKTVTWIDDLKKAGLKVCIVSNARESRVKVFNKGLNLPHIFKALKPSKKPFMKAARLMELKPSQIAVIGDQIFTDILGGNYSGMFTILVMPIDKKESILIKLKRVFEKFVLKMYKKANNIRI